MLFYSIKYNIFNKREVYVYQFLYFLYLFVEICYVETWIIK